MKIEERSLRSGKPVDALELTDTDLARVQGGWGDNDYQGFGSDCPYQRFNRDRDYRGFDRDRDGGWFGSDCNCNYR